VSDDPAVSCPEHRVTSSAERSGERADVRAVHERHAVGLDAARADAVAARHECSRRTARENLADLLDADGFVGYGPLLFAAQQRRRPREELIDDVIDPADSRRWIAALFDEHDGAWGTRRGKRSPHVDAW
jgi:acetyl-CoA carboxylase carboxyltransferase component